MIRIAIVDDHVIVRQGIRSMLSNEVEFDVVADASSADDIVGLVDQCNPDVVLLDARMPGVSGPEACRVLNAARHDVAVLMISTFSDETLVDECIRAGARGYLVKDIDEFMLKDSIRSVHTGGGALSSSVAGKVFDHLRNARAADSTMPHLTDAQHDILRLMTEGFSNREIASKVFLSENTVKSHVQEIFRKFNVRNRVEAAIRAIREGWL
jgi:two-component system, NarL family, response regulator DevR